MGGLDGIRHLARVKMELLASTFVLQDALSEVTKNTGSSWMISQHACW